MILDLGSGSNPQGHVNLDLYYGKSPHHKGFIEGKNYSNFIQGTVMNLPIRNSVFSTVYCSHVLEHLKDPSIGVLELKRVSKNIVFIKVPNNPYIEFKEHYYTWSKTSLQHYLELFFKKVKVIPHTTLINSRLVNALENNDNAIINKIGKRISRILREIIGLELVAICVK
jgi:ubiquinone/menaquinone biosynthesis C-methylase UbiE